jgi:LEA14-like dessication related protein
MLQRLLILVVLGLVGCSTLPRDALAPEVSVADVQLSRLGVFEQHFDVGLRVVNANEFPLNVEAMTFELEVNGQPFLHGQSQRALLIPAASTSVVRVDATTRSEDLLTQMRVLQNASLKAGVPYRIKGRMKTDRFPFWVPFDRQGVYGGIDKPAVR